MLYRLRPGSCSAQRRRLSILLRMGSGNLRSWFPARCSSSRSKVGLIPEIEISAPLVQSCPMVCSVFLDPLFSPPLSAPPPSWWPCCQSCSPGILSAAYLSYKLGPYFQMKFLLVETMLRSEWKMETGIVKTLHNFISKQKCVIQSPRNLTHKYIF